MTNALAAFLSERADERGMRQRDVVSASGLSRQVVSKWMKDARDQLTRLPDRETLDGFARALGVPTSVLLSKAVEALGLGYESGDFINAIGNASEQELLDELRQRQASYAAEVDELASLAAQSDDRGFAAAAREFFRLRSAVVHGSPGTGKSGSFALGTRIDLVNAHDVDIAMTFLTEAEGNAENALLKAGDLRRKDPTSTPEEVIRVLARLVRQRNAQLRTQAETLNERFTAHQREALVAAVDRWQSEHSEPPDTEKVLARAALDLAQGLVRSTHSDLRAALDVAQAQLHEDPTPLNTEVAQLIYDWVVESLAQDEAARHSEDLPPRGQRDHGYAGVGEESQDPGDAATA